MSNTIPLIDLFGKKFIIPSYQRGYKWEWQEVTDLLNDIWEFQENAENGEFYCLQPIVLSSNGNNTFDVIDGQQRLTTLYLVLVYLEERRIEEGYKEELFTLNYKTRINCEKYLKGRDYQTTIDESNIDYYHISHAYQFIKKWFEGQPGSKLKLIPILLDKDTGKNKNVKLIWYEIDKNENPIDAFIRLNIGKIELTDAELIKALLLQADKYAQHNLVSIQKKLYKIASEWDQIEYKLQEEEFWYFLNSKENKSPTHIEFIFKIIANKKADEYPQLIKKRTDHKLFDNTNLKHSTFLIISGYLEILLNESKADNDDDKRLEAVTIFWEEVIDYYQFFLEWFTKRDLYHYVGYLLSVENQIIIEDLIKEAKASGKKEFIGKLKHRISDTIVYNKVRKNKNDEGIQVMFDDLAYETSEGKNDKAIINRILLLHNIITTLNSEKELARFPFNLYKKTKGKEKWSLEHIHAQHSDNIVSEEHQKTWLKDHITSLKNIANNEHDVIIEKMVKARDKEKLIQDEFERIYQDVTQVFNKLSDMDDDQYQKIGNLCLIDGPTNSQLNSSVFDVKREKIKKRELNGFYIPICSRNVFLKSFSEYPQSNAYWTENDRKHYVKNMKIVLKDFLQPCWK